MCAKINSNYEKKIKSYLSDIGKRWKSQGLIKDEKEPCNLWNKLQDKGNVEKIICVLAQIMKKNDIVFLVFVFLNPFFPNQTGPSRGENADENSRMTQYVDKFNEFAKPYGVTKNLSTIRTDVKKWDKNCFVLHYKAEGQNQTQILPAYPLFNLLCDGWNNHAKLKEFYMITQPVVVFVPQLDFDPHPDSDPQKNYFIMPLVRTCKTSKLEHMRGKLVPISTMFDGKGDPYDRKKTTEYMFNKLKKIMLGYKINDDRSITKSDISSIRYKEMYRSPPPFFGDRTVKILEIYAEDNPDMDQNILYFFNTYKGDELFPKPYVIPSKLELYSFEELKKAAIENDNLYKRYRAYLLHKLIASSTQKQRQIQEEDLKSNPAKKERSDELGDEIKKFKDVLNKVKKNNGLYFDYFDPTNK